MKRVGLIDESHGDVLDKLRQGRNLVVHGQAKDLSPTEAAEYRRLADQMMEYLNRKLAGD